MGNTNQSSGKTGDLENMSRDELEKMTKDVPGIAQSKMNKQELIDAISQHKSSNKQ